MITLLLKLNGISSVISSRIGDVIIPWEDQHCQAWEEITTEWQRWSVVPCEKIWAKIYDKWETITTNWENIKD